MEIVFNAFYTLCYDPLYRDHIEKYSYTESDGSKVLSWDHAKYVNHSCDANTLSTGYGFEIAVRDIRAGEEITDDYGMLNIERPMACYCNSHTCRGHIGTDDFESLYEKWDSQVRNALSVFNDIEQPLLPYLAQPVRALLDEYLAQGEKYISVRNLQRRISRDNVA